TLRDGDAHSSRAAGFKTGIAAVAGRNRVLPCWQSQDKIWRCCVALAVQHERIPWDGSSAVVEVYQSGRKSLARTSRNISSQINKIAIWHVAERERIAA